MASDLKTLLLNAIHLLLPNPLLRHNGPSTVVATVSEQTAQNRQVIHLLHYIPERRGQAFDVIEDIIPLYQLELSVRADQKVQGVSLVPQGQPLDFKRSGGRLIFTVPQVFGHQMIEIAYS